MSRSLHSSGAGNSTTSSTEEEDVDDDWSSWTYNNFPTTSDSVSTSKSSSDDESVVSGVPPLTSNPRCSHQSRSISLKNHKLFYVEPRLWAAAPCSSLPGAGGSNDVDNGGGSFERNNSGAPAVCLAMRQQQRRDRLMAARIIMQNTLQNSPSSFLSSTTPWMPQLKAAPHLRRNCHEKDGDECVMSQRSGEGGEARAEMQSPLPVLQRSANLYQLQIEEQSGICANLEPTYSLHGETVLGPFSGSMGRGSPRADICGGCCSVCGSDDGENTPGIFNDHNTRFQMENTRIDSCERHQELPEAPPQAFRQDGLVSHTTPLRPSAMRSGTTSRRRTRGEPVVNFLEARSNEQLRSVSTPNAAGRGGCDSGEDDGDLGRMDDDDADEDDGDDEDDVFERGEDSGQDRASHGDKEQQPPPQLAMGNSQNAIRVPASVVAEMFLNVGKNAKLGTEFIRKFDSIQYTFGVPWLWEATHRWLMIVMFLQIVVWLLVVLSVVTMSLSGKLPRFLPALIAPFLTLHHFLGYLSYARRSPLLCGVYSLGVLVTAAVQGTELASSLRELTVRETVSTSTGVITAVACLTGLVVSVGLFFASITLFLRIRQEEHETRILIPVETLEEAPNEWPFVRWYFMLPLAESPALIASQQPQPETHRRSERVKTSPSNQSPRVEFLGSPVNPEEINFLRYNAG